MPKDLFTLKKTIPLYDDFLCGAKVNKIIQPNKDSIVLTLFNKKVFNVILSTYAKYARLSLTNNNHVSPLTAPNFCMLLRKYLNGATIKGVKICNDDRIVCINLQNVNDFKEFKNYELYLELMGKYSNVFLTADGIILGSLKSMPQNLENSRLCFIGAKYVFPKKPNKSSIFNSQELFNVLSNASFPISSEFILKNFLDFAPTTANELSHYISKTCKDNSSTNAIYNSCLEFINKPLSPTIISSKEYSDVLPFDYESVQGEKHSFSNYIDAEQNFYLELEETDKILKYKNTLSQKVLAFKKKEEKKHSILQDRIKKCRNYEQNKLYGELITANIFKIKKGDLFIEAVNYYKEDMPIVKIPLDENLYPQENAQRYYKKYSKEKKTIDITSVQLEKTNTEIIYADNLLYDINNANTVLELNEIERELIIQDFIKEQSNAKSSKKIEPIKYLTYNIGGFKVLVGKNNLQNEALLLEANKNDLWLHVKDYHSSFVIIKTEGKTPTDEVILTSAEICAHHSNGKNSTKISVDCTLRKYVKKRPNSRPGSVIYTDYKTYIVNPNEHSDKL